MDYKKRNKRVLIEYAEGVPMDVLSGRYGVTKTRITQIANCYLRRNYRDLYDRLSGELYALGRENGRLYRGDFLHYSKDILNALS